MKDDTSPHNYNQPVAYDAQGRPLYAHPPLQPQQPAQPTVTVAPQVVQMTRAADPIPVQISDEVKARHEESARLYPQLNLSEGEYIINKIRRHPIGLVIPISLTVLLAAIVLAVLMFYPTLQAQSATTLPSFGSIVMPALLLVTLICIFGYIAVYVYLNNRFFLTNESVVQEIQTTLLAHHEQTVSLANIEDASYQQTGVFQMMFNYGSIRLSTEGDETTYRFYYVSNPKQQIAILNNAVEAFKNGRPVTGD